MSAPVLWHKLGDEENSLELDDDHQQVGETSTTKNDESTIESEEKTVTPPTSPLATTTLVTGTTTPSMTELYKPEEQDDMKK